MAGQQQYTPDMMDAHASKTVQSADQMLQLFNQIKTDIHNLQSSGGWQDQSVMRAIEQLEQMTPGMNNLNATLHNHSDVTRKQAASARQLSTAVH